MATGRPQKHGLRRLKDAIRARGMDALDHRTGAVKAMVAFRTSLVSALGGPQHISPQREVLVDSITRTKLFIDSVDVWLLSQGSLINRRKKSVLPALKERQTLVDSMARLLSQVGLDRQEYVPTLAEYLDSPEHEAAVARAREEQAAYARESESAPEPSPDDSNVPASAPTPATNVTDEEKL
jgi:hypothetical protein